MSHDTGSLVEQFLLGQSGGRATKSKISKGVGKHVDFDALVASGLLRQAKDSGGNVLKNHFELNRTSATTAD